MDNTIKVNSIESERYLSKISKFVKSIGFESFIWTASLLYLALIVNPFETHFTICPLSNLGFEHCPGCGLGNSIAFLFRGNFIQSINSHILGVPALIIILHRIFSLVRFNLKRNNHNK